MIIVKGPHFAVPTISSEGAHVPSRSIVPGPQSMLLQAGAVVVANARIIRVATRISALLEGDVVLAEVREDRHICEQSRVRRIGHVDVDDATRLHRALAADEDLGAWITRGRAIHLLIDREAVEAVEDLINEEL